MNEFVVVKKPVLTPQQMVLGVMGISMDELINAIRENRDGKFDQLYVQQPEPARKVAGA